MSSPDGVIFVIDDDEEMVKALSRMLRARKFEVRGFTSVSEFFEVYTLEKIACLVLDVAMPGLDGLEVQQLLTHQGILIPIVFLTGHGDIPMSVRAIKAGAIDFLTKPVDADILADAVTRALKIAETQHREIAETAGHRAIAAMMSFVDSSDPAAGRLASERRLEARRAGR